MLQTQDVSADSCCIWALLFFVDLSLRRLRAEMTLEVEKDQVLGKN